MRNLGIVFVTVLGLCSLLLPGQAIGQDFNQLLEAVDKIDAGLKKLVEQESVSRKIEMKALRAELAALKGQSPTGASNGELVALKKQVNQLNRKVAKMPVGGSLGTDEQALMPLANDIEFLKAEISLLRSFFEKNRTALASLNNDVAIPTGSDERIDQLSEHLETLNRNVESLLANPPSHSGKSASVKPYPKVKVSGRVYSHGLADFSDDSQSYNEFALSRAYVTLKSKLSSYASLRITSDLRTIDNKYDIILKYAYLDYQPAFTNGYAKMRFGLQPTQYIDHMNKLWGRRYLEKTVSDKKKFLTSSDLGLSTIIGLGPKSQYGFVSLALLNGTSYSSVQELNKQKDINIVGLVKPFMTLPAFKKSVMMVQLYSGTQNKAIEDIVAIDTIASPWDTTITPMSGSDWKRQMISAGGLLAWNSTIDAGFDLNFTTAGKGVGYDAVKKRGLSFFGTFYLKKLAHSPFMKSLNFFWRIDSYDPDTDLSNNGETLAIVGVESVPVKGFKVALNYRSASFEDDTRNSDKLIYVNTLFKF